MALLNVVKLTCGAALLCGTWAAAPASAQTSAPQQQMPNIIFIMGDDVGWSNIGVYNQGIMAGRTPNLDQLASEGIRFTDYYAEASCTAGRANFITGELPIRTGLTTVGQAGAPRCARLSTASQATGLSTGAIAALIIAGVGGAVAGIIAATQADDVTPSSIVVRGLRT